MSCSPLHKGGQNPFCFILHSCPSEVILLVSKAGGNRRHLCTWGDIKTLVEKGKDASAPHELQLLDVSEEQRCANKDVLCVLPSRSPGWCLIKVPWVLLEEPQAATQHHAMLLAQKGVWERKLGSVHGYAALLIVKVFLLFFVVGFFFVVSLLAFVLVLKHNELTKVPDSVTWPHLMSMCDLIQITHLYLNHIGNQQSVGLFTGYLKVSCPS